MGLKYRSPGIKLGPVRVRMTKTGLSVSLKAKGVTRTYNTGTGKTTTTVKTPVKGLYYQETTGGKKKEKKVENKKDTNKKESAKKTETTSKPTAKKVSKKEETTFQFPKYGEDHLVLRDTDRNIKIWGIKNFDVDLSTAELNHPLALDPIEGEIGVFYEDTQIGSILEDAYVSKISSFMENDENGLLVVLSKIDVDKVEAECSVGYYETGEGTTGEEYTLIVDSVSLSGKRD